MTKHGAGKNIIDHLNIYQKVINGTFPVRRWNEIPDTAIKEIYLEANPIKSPNLRVLSFSS